MPQEGLIIRSTGSWYDVLTPDGHVWQGRLQGRFKIRGLQTSNPLAVGDRVDIAVEDETENTVIISHIHERRNYLARQSVHKTAQAHLLAANLDQSVLLVTMDFPRTSLGFIDRFLVSAEAFRIPVLVVFNKIDLFDAAGRAAHQALQNLYEGLGYGTLLTSTLTGEGIADFHEKLSNRVSLVAGHSGVGKSSLINAIAPGLTLRTGEVSTFANKGIHTTTFAEMFQPEPGLFLIDTPGIKELGLIDMEPAEISHYFPEMRDLLNQCRFHNCLHLNEPGCAVQAAVAQGRIAESRYLNYLSMIEGDDNRR